MGGNGLTKAVPVRKSYWDRGRPCFNEKPSFDVEANIDNKTKKPKHRDESDEEDDNGGPNQAAPQLSAFQAKLLDLEKQRDAMAAANNAFKREAETRAATQVAEMQSLLTRLTALQSLVAKNQ